MHAKRRTRTILTFAGEKQLVADMIDGFLFKGGYPVFITAVEGLSLDIYAESNGSATMIILSQVVQQLTMRGMTDLRRHLASLAKYLRESPDEPIEVDVFVQRIIQSAK